jgi:hypothetical protein
MPEFETFSEEVEYLKTLSGHLPVDIRNLGERLGARVDVGERHGSWLLRMMWQRDGLIRTAEVALTNPEPTPDNTTTASYITVRSSASNDQRYVAEDIYNRRRSVRGLHQEQLEDWLFAALQRADGYSESSLIEGYETGISGAGVTEPADG